MSVKLHTAVSQTFHAQQNKLRPGMMKMGLSPGQPKILRYLTIHNNCMQKEIASALDIEPATVSQLLNNMVQAGLIQRSAPAERRRAESISITEKGRAAYEKWELHCHGVEEISMQGFTQMEQEQLLDYLLRMYRNLTGKNLE